MKLSEVLGHINIENRCINERNFESLGLVGYNTGNNVCTFVESAEYLKKLTPSIVMVLVNDEVYNKIRANSYDFGICIVDNPRFSFFRLHNYLAKQKGYRREEFDTTIGQGCNINVLASIAEKNVKIGNNVTIEEFVVIRENTIIGDNTIIRAGCKIGGEGFEFKNSGKEVFRVDHIGGVILKENVEIQYNSCIDKAIYPWDNTVIGRHVKIDNLVHIGHAVKIGERTMVVANSGIGGRVFIGSDSWVGFGATIRNGITIGEHTRANIGAVVTKSMENYDAVTGNFAIPHSKFIENLKK